MARRNGRGSLVAGYTVIELMVVVLVLALLSLLVFPMAEMTVQRDKEQELKRALWEMRDAIDAYKRAADAGLIAHEADTPAYPESLLALTQGVANPKAGGQLMYFLRRVPRDPFADPALPPERTWGLRSYESPADRPQAGANVYDVFSRSEKIGLNGVPLREW